MSQPPSPPSENSLLIAAQEHIRILAKQVEDLKAHTRQAMQVGSLGSATAIWAHELRNFLTPMMNWAHEAVKTNEQNAVDTALRIVLENGLLVTEMVNNILELGGLNSDPRPDRIPLEQAVREAVRILMLDSRKGRIEVRTEIPPGLCVWVDPHSLKHILFNLILNTIKILQGSGVMEFSAKREGAKVILRVRDNGPGVPPEICERLFEPFISVNSTRAKPYCGGIGLALCNMLVTEAGGSIELESTSSEGTCIRVALPAARQTRNITIGRKKRGDASASHQPASHQATH